MELREWAIRILSADTLEEKLFTPQTLSDEHPGSPLYFDEPVRPIGLQFRNRRSKKEKIPPFHEHHKEENRAACLHRFAGHELLAVEIMAYALLKFPEAPKTFRRGVAHTLKEEQGHVRLYIDRLQEMGVTFGDLPLYKHFWAHTPHLHSPIHYVSVMNLTFEMANLDFAPMYGASFKRNGDLPSSLLMNRILQDEINHVSFGWRWLQRLKKQHLSDWEAWSSSLGPILEPRRAKGFILHEEPRLQAGVSMNWINHLKSL